MSGHKKWRDLIGCSDELGTSIGILKCQKRLAHSSHSFTWNTQVFNWTRDEKNNPTLTITKAEIDGSKGQEV